VPARVIAVEQCLAEASGLLVEKLMTRLEAKWTPIVEQLGSGNKV